MADAPRLTLADQALANCLLFLSVQVVEDSRYDLILRCLPDLLAVASRDITPVRRLVAAGRDVHALAAHRKSDRSGAWAQAMMALQAALADFVFWRGGLAIDALRAQDPDFMPMNGG